MMKQFVKLMKKCLPVLWASLTVSIFFSCNIGLGQTVDTETPVAAITVPDPNSVMVIRDSFPISGNWTDDGTIESVTVSLKAEENVVWSQEAEVTTSSEENGKGNWTTIANHDEIPDGSYIVTVTITDKAKHSSSVTSSIIVDNTAPIIVLSRPSTEAASTSPDSYGQTFSLQGSAADDNNVSLVKVKVFSDSALTNEVHTIDLLNVPNSIDLDIAHFTAGDTTNDYYKIYGSSDVSSGEKTFYCSLIAYDSAVRIPIDGSAQAAADLEGNASDKYYLNDSVADLLRTYKISGLYHIKNGTYTSSSYSREVGESVLSSLSSNEISAGIFTLNPANNPSFSMADSYVLSTKEDGSYDWTNVYNNTSATITVSPGLDGIAIDSARLKVYAQKCDAAGKIIDSTKIYPSFTGPEASGTSYKITPTVLKSEGFAYDSYYVWGMDGTDTSGNSILAISDLGYGFYFSKQGLAPTLKVTSPADSTSYVKKDGSLLVSGSVEYKEDKGNFAIYLGDSQLVSATAGVPATGLSFVQDAGNELKYTYEYTIPASTFNSLATSSSQLSLKVQADNSYITKDVKYDFDGPAVTIKVSPIASLYEVDSQGFAIDESGTSSGTYVNGNVSVSVSIKDDYDVISASENTIISISGQNNSTITSDGVKKSLSETYTVDTTAIADNNPFTVSVTTFDRAGNKTVQSATYTVLQKTDSPVILPSESEKFSFINMKTKEQVSNQQSSLNKLNLFSVNDGDKHLLLSVRDDDSGECTVGYKVEEFTDNTENPYTVRLEKSQKGQITNGKGTFDITLGSLDSGVYKVTLTVKDANENERTIAFHVRVVPEAPSLNITSFDSSPYVSLSNTDSNSLEASLEIVSALEPFKLTYQIKRGNTIVEDFKDFSSLTNISCISIESGTHTPYTRVLETSEGKLYYYDFIPATGLSYPDGTYTIQYRVYDGNGLYGNSEVKTFYVDSTAALVTGITVPSTTSDVANSYSFTTATSSSVSVIAPETYYYSFTDSASSQPELSDFVKATSDNTYKMRFTTDEHFTSVFANEGEKTVWYYVKDAAANKSSVNHKNFYYDKNLPTASISLSSGDSIYLKERFNLALVANDSWGLKEIKLYENDEVIRTITDFTSSETDYSDTISGLPNIDDIEDHYGEYTYKVIVTDKAGRESVASELLLYFDTKKPTLSILSTSGSVLSGTTGELEGIVFGQGLRAKTLYYYITETNDEQPAESVYKSNSQADGDWKVSQSLKEGPGTSVTNQGLYEGAHYLWVYAEDLAGNKSDVKSVMFYVDQKPPVISSTASIQIKASDDSTVSSGSLSTGSVYYLKMPENGTISISGTIKETNGLKAVSATCNESNYSASLTRTDTENWSYTITGISLPDTNDTEIPITITATDLANQTSEETSFIVYNDTATPVITFINPNTSTPSKGENSLKGTSYTYKATIEDSGSKLASLKYCITDSETAPDAVSTTWQDYDSASVSGKATVAFSLTEKLTSEGQKYLHFIATDSVGNSKDDKVSFWIDQSTPSLTVSDILATGQIVNNVPVRNKGFDLKVTADDANGIEKVEISSESFETITLLTAADTATHTFNSLEDGSHAITVTATDKAGRTTSVTKSVVIDTVSPVGNVSISSDSVYTESVYTESDSNSVSYKWYNSQTIGILVSDTSDVTSGVYQIYATTDSLTDEDGNENTSISWINLTKTSTSNQYSGKIICPSQGSNVITIRITDNAGNNTDKIVNPYIDTTAPDTATVSTLKVADESFATSGTVLVNGTKDMTVTLTAQDADNGTGIKSVSLYKIGSAEKNISSTDTESPYSITIDEDNLSSSGTLIFKITDNALNTYEYTSNIFVDLDKTYPKVTMNSITDADTSTTNIIDVNKKITITGTASDNNTLSSLQLWYRTSTSESFSDDVWTNYGSAITSNMDSWSVEVNTESLTPPVTTPATTDKYYVQFRMVATDTALNTGNSGNIRDSSGSNAYSDNAVKTVYVNKNTDYPIITFTSLDLTGMTASEPAKTQNQLIRGNVSDDDGTIQSLEYSVDEGITWKTDNLTRTGVTFTLKLNDDSYEGSKAICFKVTDGAGNSFTSECRIKDKNNNEVDSDGKIHLIVDTQEPAIKNVAGSRTVAEASVDLSTGIFAETFGGPSSSGYNTLYVELYAWDINGISSVAYSILDINQKEKAKGTFAETGIYDTDGYQKWKTSAINVSSLASGTYSFKITVTDGGNKNKTVTRSLSVDTTAPVINITSPAAETQEGSDFYMEGSFDDGDADTKLYYQITKDSATASALSWTNANTAYGNSAITWKLYFDSDNLSVQDEGSDGYSHYLSPKYIIAALRNDVVISNGTAYKSTDGQTATSEKFTTVGTYYFHLKAVDAYGNPGYKTIELNLDPQGDIPTVKLEYPAQEKYAYYNSTSKTWEVSDEKATSITKNNVTYSYVGPMATMSGIIRASGSATLINNSLDLYMQIDPSYNPAAGFSSTWYSDKLTGTAATATDQKAITDEYTVADFGPDGSKKKGIHLGSSLSWAKNINTKSEFEIYGSDATNYIAIRLYAYDDKGNFSQTDDDIFIIRINSGAPKIGSSVPLQLKKYADMANPTGTPTAILDYTNNMWVKGEWYLEGSVEDEEGISELTITGGSGSLIKSDETTWGSGSTATKGYTFRYKVGSSSGAETLTYNISATDVETEDGTGTHSSSKTITLRTDNNAPTLADSADDYYNISSEVINSNGFYTIQSAATETSDESGFLRTVVYFKRTVTGYQNVYDSYIKKGSTTGNEIAYAGLHTEDNLYWKTGSVVSIDTTNKRVTISASDANIHNGGLVKLGGLIYTIKEGAGTTTLTLNDAPDSSLTAGTPIYFAIGHVIDHVGSESKGTDICDDNDDGYGYYTDIADDDGDRMLESVSTVGTKTRWMGKINSQNIPDGAIEIHYVVFDQAGNVAYAKVDAVVQNNAPRIASLKVSTDYNGNGNEDLGEYKTYYYSGKTRNISGTGSVTRATEVTKKLVVSKNGYGPTDSTPGNAYMTVHGDVVFTPEIIGGNDELYFSYKKGSAAALENATVTNGGALKNASGTALSGQDSTTGNYIKSDEDSQSYVEGQKAKITLAASALGANSTEDEPTWFEYTIWDSTPGTTQYVDSLNAKFQVALKVLSTDETAPKAVVSPFFWNSASANSLYHNSKDNGHIELEADWKESDGYTSAELATEVKDDDPKVSGKITVRGYIYDDVQLKELYVKIPDFVPGTYLFSTDYVKVAYYENGTWNPVVEGVADDAEGTNISTNHWTVSVTDEYNNGSGHKANFEFSWDTSYITGVAAANVTFYAQAVAVNGSSTTITTSNETHSTADTTEGVYNKPTYQMDIVPYITSLTTSLSSLKPANPTVFSRTALGHYPVYDGERIILNGFNLVAGNTSKEVTLSNGRNSGKFDYKDTNNNIPALNNYNTKDAQGSYGYDTSTIASQGNKNVYDNFYNRWPNGANNNNLTDDVILDVWEFDPTAAIPVKGHIDQPIMKINPVDGNIGFAFADGALYYSMGGKVSDTLYSYYYWMGAYDSFTSVAFAYDNLGYTYGIGAGGDINDSNTPSMDNLSFMTSRWGICNHSAGASKDDTNHIRMEKIGQLDSSGDLVVNKQRTKSPSLATTVQSDNSTTNIYFAYYDAMNDEVRFRYGKTKSTSRTTFDKFQNIGGVGASAYSADNVNIVARGTSQTGKKAGKYVSIAVIPDAAHGTADTVVIVWFDETNRTLWYAYNSSPLSSTTGENSGSEWKVSRVFPETATYKNAGENCQIAVDANGHVHIAAYDQNNCDLLYAYTSTPTATNPGFKTCIVDSDGVVGSNISLDVALKEDGGQAIPRIGYYAASCVKPKYAWLVSESTNAPAGAVSDSFTGNWECTVVPTTSSLIIDNSKQTNLINVGIWKDKATGVIKDSTTGDKVQNNTFNKYSSTNNGLLYGNGTSNAVLGYVISQDASNDSIEVAQMR